MRRATDNDAPAKRRLVPSRGRYRPAWRVVVFGVLEGLVLGSFVGWVTPESFHDLIPAPGWLRWKMVWCCAGAFLLLPVWSLVAVRSHRGLLLAGLLTFVIVCLIGLLPVT